MSVALHEDVARFDAYDANAVVAASFACPYCLELPGSVLVDLVEHLAVAYCCCDACDAEFVVHLDDTQALRLALAPPPELPRPARR